MGLQITNNQKSFKFLSSWQPSEDISLRPATIVVTCFVQSKDKILVLQRGRNDEQYQLWGIPGGKLNKQEVPLEGLIRELLEETGIDFSSQAFNFLDTARSVTPTDGEYGLYLYHTKLNQDCSVKINFKEHLDYQWVTLEEFKRLDLLTAQGEAFNLVEDKVYAKITHDSS